MSINVEEIKNELFAVSYDILRLEKEVAEKRERRLVLQGMYNVLGRQEMEAQQLLAATLATSEKLKEELE